ncbi:uncharacterized protein [Taeniopygia guttata]|uniref:uncharacterized protein isoform X2 n=1 Tax=Taeniopygia guttata TaxID=59729 RepID=UPI003BB8B1B7
MQTACLSSAHPPSPQVSMSSAGAGVAPAGTRRQSSLRSRAELSRCTISALAAGNVLPIPARPWRTGSLHTGGCSRRAPSAAGESGAVTWALPGTRGLAACTELWMDSSDTEQALLLGSSHSWELMPAWMPLKRLFLCIYWKTKGPQALNPLFLPGAEPAERGALGCWRDRTVLEGNLKTSRNLYDLAAP